MREAAVAHLTIVIIVTRSLGALGPIVEALVILTGTRQDRVICMSLDVLLQVLRPLEAFAAHVTFVRLQRHMDPDMRGDVISLDSSGAAGIPLASEAEVVGTLATNMTVTNVFIKSLGVGESLEAMVPAAGQVVIGRTVLGYVRSRARGSRRIGFGVAAAARGR